MNLKQESVGSLKKGSYLMIEGAPCRVSDVKVSRPGKHGHAKVNLTAVGVMDDKKRNIIMPGHDKVDVPLIDKRTAQVLSVSGDHANVMDLETYETFDLDIPSEMKEEVSEGVSVMYWLIVGEKVMKQVKSD
jgi:translation initiation factor 5A